MQPVRTQHYSTAGSKMFVYSKLIARSSLIKHFKGDYESLY